MKIRYSSEKERYIIIPENSDDKESLRYVIREYCLSLEDISKNRIYAKLAYNIHEGHSISVTQDTYYILTICMIQVDRLMYKYFKSYLKINK